MARPYTERFFHITGAAVTATYTVPAGMRAVVRNVLLVNRNAAANSAFLWIPPGNFWVYQSSIPASGGFVSFETRVALYGGESISGNWSLASGFMTVSGYLFEDPTGAGGPPGGLQLERDELVAPLPVASRATAA